jgi:hypothetical protein
MRAHVSLLVLVFGIPVIAGCEKSPRDRLQGKWLGESVENVPASQADKASGWVRGTAIEFQGNKVTVTIPAETPRTGTFKVAQVERDTLAVSFLRPEGGRDEARMQLVGEEGLRWELGDGRQVVMKRAAVATR